MLAGSNRKKITASTIAECAADSRAECSSGDDERELHPGPCFEWTQHVRGHHRWLGRAIGERLDEDIAVLEYPDLQENLRGDSQNAVRGAEQGDQQGKYDHEDEARELKRNQKNAQVVHNARAASAAFSLVAWPE
jgi:hypothetical protein